MYIAQRRTTEQPEYFSAPAGNDQYAGSLTTQLKRAYAKRTARSHTHTADVNASKQARQTRQSGASDVDTTI